MDSYAVLKYPLTTESAMKKIEDNNTLVRRRAMEGGDPQCLMRDLGSVGGKGEGEIMVERV